MRVLPVLVSRGWVRVVRNVTTQVYKYAELPSAVRAVALEEWADAWGSRPYLILDECEFMADGRIWK